MKKSKTIRFSILTTLAVVSIISGLVLSFISPSSTATSFVSFGVALFVITLLMILRSKRGIKPDERDIKISQVASTYSWFYTYLIVAILILINHFKLLTLTVEQVLGIVFFAMISIQLGFRYYFNKRGLKQ